MRKGFGPKLSNCFTGIKDDKLDGQIETLYSEIYGAAEIIGIAQEQVKSMTPEQRLKAKGR
jgi:hypothetical protein